MKKEYGRPLEPIQVGDLTVSCSYIHTVVIGSGAASLSAAVRLKKAGLEDICLFTDNMKGGTSRNTGSDKQTYYKLSDSSRNADSPYLMAEALYNGGAMHGDIALAESLGSGNGFYHLVGLGVPFPYGKLGGYVGYKTDHDPGSRGISLGPYTSKIMVEYLEKECLNLGIPLTDHHDCVKLLQYEGRIAGAIFMNKKELDTPHFGLHAVLCDNMVFGVGGPGGFYKTSVYPAAQSGGIGLALEIGAEAVNLTESQYGIGSVKFRWNLSGSYQQVVPRYFSRDPETGEEYEFLNDFFHDMTTLTRAIFLKGYQWPFDPAKIENYGSSLIDLLVYRESEVMGRHVFIDFCRNPEAMDGTDFSTDLLSAEVREYWTNSGLDGETPIQRLEQLNSEAISLYKDHNIDLYQEPLQIAVCAQHNNGGLHADIWWESVNLKHFFPVGEVNGSHGIARPGGSALNSGQVGAFRASQKIAGAYGGSTLDMGLSRTTAEAVIAGLIKLIRQITADSEEPLEERRYQKAIQQRMTLYGSFVRELQGVEQACREAYDHFRSYDRLRTDRNRLPFVLKLRHIALAHRFYLESIRDFLQKGGGSRGSCFVKTDDGMAVHPKLEGSWKMKPENQLFKKKMQTIRLDGNNGLIVMEWIDCRPIPEEDAWFERVWADYLNKTVYCP